MADEIVVATADATVTVPQTDEGDFEVTREWVESLFANVVVSLSETGRAVSQLAENQRAMSEILSSLQSRLPENLIQLISTQEATIRDLFAQGQETTREILRAGIVQSISPPQPEPTLIPEPENVEVVNPVAETNLPPESARRKRRLI